MFKKDNIEDIIHLRAIKYGINFPSGFMYKYFQKHYEKRDNDWKIVNEFFQEAYNNKNGASSRTTPFVLLEKMGNGNADESKYILSYEAYFNYLAYWNSKKAITAAMITIGISIVILTSSFYYSYKQINSQNKSEISKISEIKKSDQNIINKTHSDPEKYGGEVLQLGGEGSKIHQVTAHLLTEHGYLFPPEDWIKVFFNNSGDAMTVECKAGYKIDSCVANKGSSVDNSLGCRATLGEKMKNIVSVTCIKE